MMRPLRADRLATLYFVRPLRRLIARRNPWRIPILMYHSVSESSNKSVHPYFAADVCAQVFSEQMKYLHENEYSTISLDQVVALLNSNHPLSRKYVVITFDDGYRDFYTEAFPILREYGFRSQVFLPTAFVNHRSRTFKGKDCLTWGEVRELHRAGVVFGSHTVTHPQLRCVSNSDLEHEIRCSKETIESELGTPVHSFSYPYAFPVEDRVFTRRLWSLLEESGYQNGVSTSIGSVQSLNDRFFLRRLPVNSWDDRALFQAKLEGDYDWLRHPQYLKKLTERQQTASAPPTRHSVEADQW